MNTETHETQYWQTKNVGFLTATPDCDLLHPESKNVNPSPSLTETQLFGFSVPEAGIHSVLYLWHHPNLGVASGGAWVWQGFKSHALESELYNYANYMSDDVLANDLWDYRLDGGYHVQTIEPLKKHRVRYLDEARQNAFDIEFEAMMEPALLQAGVHFEQAVRGRGELTLRGTTYQVDSPNVRDRSWAQSRREYHASTPPIDWMTGVFSEAFIFCCTAYDHPDLSPQWRSRFEVPGGDPTKGGWVYREGTLVPIVASRKRVHLDDTTLAPSTAEMVLTDAEERDYEIRGEVVAANRVSFWPAMDNWICLMRWECGGQTCYGDLQHIRWHDYVRDILGPRP